MSSPGDKGEAFNRLKAVLGEVPARGGSEGGVSAASAPSPKPVPAARRDRKAAHEWTSSPAKVVYSSLDNRAPEGPRADADTLVQVVCNAGDYAIDLQIEPEYEAAEIALAGQVVRRTAPGEPAAGIPVRVMARKRTLAATQTNSCGEFSLVSTLQNSLRLCFDIEGAGLRVGIPLDKLTVGFRS